MIDSPRASTAWTKGLMLLCRRKTIGPPKQLRRPYRRSAEVCLDLKRGLPRSEGGPLRVNSRSGQPSRRSAEVHGGLPSYCGGLPRSQLDESQRAQHVTSGLKADSPLAPRAVICCRSYCSSQSLLGIQKAMLICYMCPTCI